jgi:hypothetical protein
VQPDDFGKRPAPEMIFVFESGPGRDKGFHMHGGPEARLQIKREGLGEESDIRSFGGGLKKRCGDDQVAQSPEFDDKKFGFQGVPEPLSLYRGKAG